MPKTPASPSDVKPVRRDTPSGRFYDVEGESYPSVTHILSCVGKPALIQWAANQERTLATDTAADLYEDIHGTPKMSRAAFVTTFQGRLGKMRAHRRELEKACEVGSQVHALIEWNLRRALGQKVGVEPRIVDDALWAWMSFEDWSKSVDLKPRFIEQTVFSRVHGYAGTMDLLADVEGRLTLVDFKTSKAIYGESHLQNVAYQQALIEMGHSTPERGLIVRLPKVQTDPAFEVVEVPPVNELFPVFLHVLGLWRWWYAQDEAWRQRRAEDGEKRIA